MKQSPALLFLTLAFLLVPLLARAADYAGVVTNTPGLLGYWRFDPVFQTNSAVNGYVGTLHGNARLGAPGLGAPVGSDPANQGLILDGQASYLTTSLGGKITNSGTTTAWIYLTNYPSVAGRIFEITAEGDSGNDFDFQINTDNLLHFYTDSGGSTTYSQTIPTNQWHFLAGTFVANSTRVIYFDGVPVATNTPGSHGIDTSFFSIGENLQFTGRYFEGTIAEVAVYSRALAASEIAAIYAAASPVLSISNAGNSVVVSWSTNFPAYNLQTNGLPVLPGAWANYPVTYNIVGLNYQVIDPIAAGQFYRLKGPGAAATLAASLGNNQTSVAGTQLAVPLAVLVTDSGGDPVPGITVNWAVTAGGGSVGSPSSVTAANGQAATTATLGSVGGANSFTATVAGLTGSPVTFNATAAKNLASNGGAGQSAVAGTQLPTALSVKVTDNGGNPVSGITVTWAVTAGGGDVGSPSTVANASGIAATTATLGSTGGANSFTATVVGLTGSPVTFTATAAKNLAINGGNAQAAVAGTQLPVSPSVLVTDNSGNPVSGITVNWAVTAGGGSVGSPSTVANASGLASTTATLGSTGGANSFTATVVGLTGSPVTFSATAAKNLARNGGNGQTAVAGTQLPASLSVLVTDNGGNPVSGITVNWAATAGGGSVGTPSTVANASGLASTTATLGTTGGANSFTATVVGLTGSPVTFTATAAKNLARNGGNAQTATAGTQLPTALSVLVTDNGGNPVSGITVTWAVTGGGGSVGAPSTVANASGVASTTATLGSVAGANSFSATVVGLTGSPVSFSATGD